MSDSRIASYVDANATRFLDELKDLLRIPSISTLPEHAQDMQRAGQFLVDQLQQRVGLAQSGLIATAGHPLVYAESAMDPARPTVLIYGHYDVQPVDPIELWHSPPFEPTIVGERIRARGAVDDKGPTMAVIKALETLHQTGGLPVNVRVLLEGEEECGGAAIAAYVQSHAAELHADCALVLDTGMIAPDQPTMTYGLRGILYCEIIATGASHDLHSGVYGGIGPNPLQALAWVLADLKGRDGRIAIPGLYEQIRPLSALERAALARQSDDMARRLAAAAGLSELPGETGYNVAERASARPSFEVHGIRGGFTGEGVKTVIPATATAKVSLRLVPDQMPDTVLAQLQARVRELAPPAVTMEVRLIHGGDAIVFSPDAPILRAAATALEEEFGRPAEFVREGGSIPVVALFDSLLHLPVVMLGFSLPDDSVHAPNESFFVPNYYAAIRSVAGFLSNLGRTR